jgi:ribose-phosphate pyrophosphokinase
MITITNYSRIIPYTAITFSGGEEHIRIDQKEVQYENSFIIHANLTSSAEIIKLMMITDALRRVTVNAQITLNMPYIPYARQDRVCNPGEALGIRVFCDLINSLNFVKVRVLMPHSDVALALLNNATDDFHQLRWDNFVADNINLTHGDLVIVSPDAGAMKRTLKFAQFYNKEIVEDGQPAVPVIMADKVRDTTTGQITSTVLHVSQTDNEVEGMICLIYDDICDGGMTFIKLAEELRFHGAAEVILAVPHGIFSKGLAVLSKVIDQIITTDVFAENMPAHRSRPVNILEVST